MQVKNSEQLIKRASEVIPGGVNSPVRAFKQVGGTPRFLRRGKGAYIWDADENKYIDYVLSWGPLILGHASDVIEQALILAVEEGTSFGAPTEREIEFAELLTSVIPALEMTRVVSSGTEATMTAIRLARAYTGRDVVIKCNGCYHGHSDSLLVQAGSGVATCGISACPGIPEAVSAATISIEFNDINLLEDTIRAVGKNKIAAFILEPVPGNMGLVLPETEYLKSVREICSRYGVVLIIDEVMTGFRVSLEGAASRFGIIPDLLTFGKVIGGGLPVGAVGGRRDIMQMLAPAGSVYQAGTLSGNPLAMAAGIAVINYLKENNPYPLLEERAQKLTSGLSELFAKHHIPFSATCCGSMFGFFFREELPRNFTEAKLANIEIFKKFFHAMLESGVYLAPSAFEAGFLSTEHTDVVIDNTLQIAAKAINTLVA